MQLKNATVKKRLPCNVILSLARNKASNCSNIFTKLLQIRIKFASQFSPNSFVHSSSLDAWPTAISLSRFVSEEEELSVLPRAVHSLLESGRTLNADDVADDE